MQRVFVDSIQKYFNDRALERMFPRMVELTELHTNFLKKLRQKQHQYYIVDSIADILLEFFSALSAQRLKSAYGKSNDADCGWIGVISHYLCRWILFKPPVCVGHFQALYDGESGIFRMVQALSVESAS